MRKLIDKLCAAGTLSREELTALLGGFTPQDSRYLFSKSRAAADRVFGKKIYMRGLIEFTNFCRNDCYYCGIRKSNLKAQRYRLDKTDILSCCEQGWALGMRTFVLQGGEDTWYTDDMVSDIVSSIKRAYPDCAVTLSIGEKTYAQYLRYYQAGADRYLLRHETADAAHYEKLHPQELSAEKRQRCLYDLKRIGYQTGAGFMVGSPFQTAENLAGDLLFLKRLDPQMVGIGPFIPHGDTPFAGYPAGSVELTLFLLGVLRLMLPNALIPATTALGSLDADGRERGILAGANVVMPNLSPVGVRKKYALYEHKLCTGEEAAEGIALLQARLRKIGYGLVAERGDYRPGKPGDIRI